MRKQMHDRRLYTPMPAIKGPQTYSKLPVRICLITALMLILGFGLFLHITGGAVLCVYFWIYLAIVACIILALLSACAFAIWHRVHGERAHRNVGVLLICLIAMLVMCAISVCMTFADMYQRPIGYYDSPQGTNSVVILRTTGEDSAYYSAYPAIGKNFYVAALESDIIQSSTGIAGVQWPEEDLAEIHLKDMDGNDAVISVDFSVLRAEEDEAQEAQE